MKKREMMILLIAVFIFVSLPFFQAQAAQSEEQQKVNNAYSCLSDIVNERGCDALSTEEKIFSLLSLNKCKNELIGDALEDGKCWPGISGRECDLKKTSQAILALSNARENTEISENWLLLQNRTPTELIWYLEIESPEETACTILYSPGQQLNSFNVNIGEDKVIDSDAGPCLSRAEGGYWLQVNSAPNCQSKEFTISCDKSFLTTLLFRKANSPTIHLSQESSSASAGGETKEKINSLCFAQGGQCNYEGSLWASFALKSKGRDVSSYLPYLITSSEEPINMRFLAESFLYYITSKTSYKISLLSKQIDDKWWSASGNRFYDTALALYSMQQETLVEKTNAKNWLLGSQEQSGCWDSNNIVNTAFILASIWPKTFAEVGGGATQNCEQFGIYYCVNRGACQGSVLEYSCPGALSECCSVQPRTEQTCAELGGVVCSSSQICSRGEGTSSASGLSSGQICCVGGTCEVRQTEQKTQCEQEKGRCTPNNCFPGEKQSNYSCDYSRDICCVQKTTQEGGKNYIWIWILLILIVLVILGIIFKNKLRELWLKRGKPKGPGPQGPAQYRGPFFPPSPGILRPRLPERRILAPSAQYPRTSPRQTSRTSKELDDVLKKLKEMGK